MKKLLKAAVFSSLSITMLYTSFSTSAYTNRIITNEQQATITRISEEYEITPFAEETGYKYKLLNGKQYKRLWSYTYARWIDPDWTLA